MKRLATRVGLGLGLIVLCGVLSRPVIAQMQPAAGSAADLEQRTFGEYLEAGKPGSQRPQGLQALMFSTVLALYNVSSQYTQVLRLCTFKASVAKDDAELREAKSCQAFALANLERYAESEALAMSDPGWLPDEAFSAKNPALAIGRWQWVTKVSSAQGQVGVAEAAQQRVQQLAEELDRVALATNAPADMLGLYDAQIGALSFAARLEYQRQRGDAFVQKLRAVLTRLDGNAFNQWGLVAMENAPALSQLGQRELARDLARRALPMVKANAGLRDVPEPVQRFQLLDSVVATLGDERTHQGHVHSLILLARAYALLERPQEAARVLEEAFARAGRYVLEPAESSTLIAQVEAEQATLAEDRVETAVAIGLLRSARTRLARAAEYTRTPPDGLRHQPFDSPLLEMNARLLAAVAASATMPLVDTALVDEVLAISKDFSASRADISARRAARTEGAQDAEGRNLLQREGRLIDELMDLRGTLASRVAQQPGTPDASAGIAATQARLAEVLLDIREVKRKLAGMAHRNDRLGLASSSRLMATLAPGEYLWQWVLHPAGNTLVCIGRDGVRLQALREPVPAMEQLAQRLHSAASLADIERFDQLKPFPLSDAALLYRALFAPLADTLPAASHWIVVPPVTLDRLPWGALMIPEAKTGTPTAWLIERVALTAVPSIHAWTELAARGNTLATKAFLGVGDPKNTAPVDTRELQKRGSLVAAVARVGSQRPRRPTAFEQELVSMASLYPTKQRTLLVGPRATKASLRSLLLSDYRVLVFSTHGYISGALAQSLGPSLELTQGKGPALDRFLTAAEVAALRLDADVVVLSACDTSATDGSIDAEGFSGLTSAFLLAGARSVVASLWPVETRATAALIADALKAYAAAPERRPFSFALRDATLLALRDPRAERSHPAMWAAFVAVGR